MPSRKTFPLAVVARAGAWVLVVGSTVVEGFPRSKYSDGRGDDLDLVMVRGALSGYWLMTAEAIRQ